MPKGRGQPPGVDTPTVVAHASLETNTGHTRARSAHRGRWLARLEVAVTPAAPTRCFRCDAHSPPFTNALSMLSLDHPALLVNHESRAWFVQNEYPGPFFNQRGRLGAVDFGRVLRGECWIATYAPGDGTVDRVEFDIDCKGGSAEVADRDERYWMIRRLIGLEHRPLVVRTPSGWGVHVSYRIPPTRLDSFITGPATGPLADALRAAGLPVQPGKLEIFPQARQCKRLPVGRGCAILHPDSLEVVCAAPEDPHEASPEWSPFGEALSEWHACEHPTLLRGLLERAAGSSTAVASRGRTDPAPAGLVHVAGELTGRMIYLMRNGLTRRASRNDAEFSIGTAIWLNPGLFEDLGPSKPLTRERVARLLAAWLARHHHGFSQEWSRDLRRWSEAAVVEAWTRRYLREDSRGEAPVDRMRTAAMSLAGDSGMVASRDMADILGLAEGLFAPGPVRYQFEVWTCALFRAVKSVVGYHEARGEPLPSGPGWQEIELLARWMEQWPWGGGSRGGRRAYVVHRDALISKGWLVPVSRPIFHREAPDIPGRATRYRVRPPRPAPLADMPIPRAIVASRLDRLLDYDRPVTPVEAYHSLHALRSVPRLDGRYGAAAAARIRRIAGYVANPLAA